MSLSEIPFCELESRCPSSLDLVGYSYRWMLMPGLMTNIYEQVFRPESGCHANVSGIQRPLKSIQEKSQSIYIPRKYNTSFARLFT